MNIRIERRGELRRRTVQAARAVFNERFSTMDCRVRDISPGGARLRFGGPPLVPSWFELWLVDKRERVRVRRVWTKGEEMGVAFEPEPQVGPAA